MTTEIKPWYAVATPHADIREGRLDEHVLRTASACEDVRRVLGGTVPEAIRAVAVFTNRTCDATQGRDTADGIHTRTLWGELAAQLGGRALYEKVRANDEAQRTTQGLFAQVLRAAAPCLILLDELADYCVGAAGVPVGDSTLADQTISFIQELTEAVQEVPGAVVVATLPASKMEVAQSEKGQEAFVTLEKRFYRLGADVKPVADEEIYDVVRTRLFESIPPPDAPDYTKKVAAAYRAMYAEHEREVPSEVCKASYREDIERAYPFHPALIDALYKRWGSHPDFQRTRGVLRMLASIVGDLWHRRDANTQFQPLIQPCHVRWSLDPLSASLTRLWGTAYQSVAAADITGEKSNAGIFDDERGGEYRREAIGRGIASAILLGSFGGQGEGSGYSAKDVEVACSRPGLNWSYTDGALLELENRCFYLHAAPAGALGKRYWFGTQPTLNRLVVQYRQRVDAERFEEEAERVAQEALGLAYVVALRIHGQEVEVSTLTDARASFDEHLEYLWTTLVESEEWIVRRVGGVTLHKAGLVPKEGAIRVKDAVDAFLRFTDKPLVASKEAVVGGLAQACADGLIGIARGPSVGSFHARYCRRSVSIDPSEDGVWIVPPFTEEPEQPSAPGATASTSGATASTTPASTAAAGARTPTEAAGGKHPLLPPMAPTIRRIRIEGAVPLESYNELFRCFVAPAARMNLKRQKLGIQFVLEAQDSAPLDPNDPPLKAMREAARQLGLDLQVETETDEKDQRGV